MARFQNDEQCRNDHQTSVGFGGMQYPKRKSAAH